MSEMTTTEILERFNESLKLAASRSREMYTIYKNKLWLDIAKSLDGIRDNGCKMALGTPLTERQVNELLDAKKAADIMKQETKH